MALSPMAGTPGTLFFFEIFKTFFVFCVADWRGDRYTLVFAFLAGRFDRGIPIYLSGGRCVLLGLETLERALSVLLL